MNIGDMLSRWSDGRGHSNLHRVRMPTRAECTPPSPLFARPENWQCSAISRAEVGVFEVVIRLPGSRQVLGEFLALGFVLGKFGDLQIYVQKPYQNPSNIVPKSSKKTPEIMPGSAWGGLWGGHRHQEGEEMGA